jgi:hypothetical protein
LGRLNTIVCAAIALSITLSGMANSQEPEPTTDRVTNRDLLEQPVRDQRIWLNALVVGFAYGVSIENDEVGVCVLDWYFDDQEQSFADLREQMRRFPDHSPSVVLIALARRACDGLEVSR